MDKILVVVFGGEREAYEGYRVLEELNGEGAISVYGEAVIVKDADGKVVVKESTEVTPVAAVTMSLVTGSLLGLIGGPAGAVLGATVGGLGGGLYDVGIAGVGDDFMQRVATRLEPGMAAVVAEVREEWVTPVDARMEAVGGIVFRRSSGDLLDAMMYRDVAAIEAEIEAMEIEFDKENEAGKARLQARIAAAETELKEAREQAIARLEAKQREVGAKITFLKEQGAKARDERKGQIDKRRAEVEAEYQELTAKIEKRRAEAEAGRKERSAKLGKAWGLAKEALKP